MVVRALGPTHRLSFASQPHNRIVDSLLAQFLLAQLPQRRQEPIVATQEEVTQPLSTLSQGIPRIQQEMGVSAVEKLDTLLGNAPRRKAPLFQEPLTSVLPEHLHQDK